jgi:cation diffusion facilitator family transporter
MRCTLCPMTEGSTKAILAAFGANFIIAIAKFIGFFITGATSMLAEAIHSVADTGNQGLLLLGGRRARRAATPDHPFGFGRSRYFYSFIVALVLFTLGGLFALFEGYEKLKHPGEIVRPSVAVIILVSAIAAEGYSLRTAVKEARPYKQDLSWWQFIRTARTPELPVVLLEDLGALIGLTLALGGLVTAVLTGNPVWDAFGTLAIGALLVVIAVVLVIEMASLLIGEGAIPATVVKIKAALSSASGIQQVINLRTQHIGPDEILVAAKIEFDASMSVAQVVEATNEAEAAIRRAVPSARYIYLEPDIHNPVYVPATDKDPNHS